MRFIVYAEAASSRNTSATELLPDITTTQIVSFGGDCPGNYEFELIELSTFEIDPYAQIDLCDSECNTLELDLPDEYIGNVSALWDPSTYLDNPTSLSPEICNPAADIVYTVTVTNDISGCVASEVYPINVIKTPPPSIALNGSENCFLPYAPLLAALFFYYIVKAVYAF